MGNLTKTDVDHCTLHFTWTAPYTLQGVPINYYNITITRHSDGAVLGSYTTNTTEFLYSVSSLGESLKVVVTAVNDVGTVACQIRNMARTWPNSGVCGVGLLPSGLGGSKAK